MKFFLLTVFVSLCAAEPFCGKQYLGFDFTVTRMYGGNDTKAGEYPWLVALLYKRDSEFDFGCGGTLISDQHVVTGEFVS